MSATISNLNLYSFYPEESFEISECLVNEKSVMIHLKSKKHNCECPRCHQISNYYHGTYKPVSYTHLTLPTNSRV